MRCRFEELLTSTASQSCADVDSHVTVWTRDVLLLHKAVFPVQGMQQKQKRASQCQALSWTVKKKENQHFYEKVNYVDFYWGQHFQVTEIHISASLFCEMQISEKRAEVHVELLNL